MTERVARVLHNIRDIDESAWNRCANPAALPYNPFLDHRFLLALEESESVCAQTGWQPFHLVVSPAGQEATPSGVMPMYLKSHSRGEYVFDGGWAEAFRRAGGRYYPKLQASIPFTPATGRRLLTADPNDEATANALLGGAVQVADKVGVSSIHFTFMPKPEWDRAAELGMLQRMDTQFHWENHGFASFDEFLAVLASKKRKNIRRERKGARANGIDFEWLTGTITEAQWDAFYSFYVDTGHRKWGTPYLTREFFSHVGETMGEQVLLIMCRREGRYIAGAINFIGEDTLFGRNWGCIEDHPFLHFEACYYQAIDFAIERGLKRVEAGAQGGHKLARGYLPKPTYSAHWIRHGGLREAVANYLDDERKYVERDIAWIEEEHTPFRQDIDLTSYRTDAASAP